MRTILHSTDRMSANSSEAGLFILFLLVFALAASAYVLYHGIYLTEPDKVGSLSLLFFSYSSLTYAFSMLFFSHSALSMLTLVSCLFGFSITD